MPDWLAPGSGTTSTLRPGSNVAGWAGRDLKPSPVFAQSPKAPSSAVTSSSSEDGPTL